MEKNSISWKDILADQENKNNYKEEILKRDSEVKSFLEFDVNKKTSKTGGTLQGIPFAVKDNIAVKDFKISCGSKMLESLVSPYTATAVSKLEEQGAVVIGKTNLDEFGMGSSTDNSALLQSSNPWDLSRVCGGSSGGSAAAVAAGLVPFALGTDTGGSIRQPAAFCGVYGLKPTYGAVSRYGLVAYASSLEVIGVLAENIEYCETVFNSMKGIDEMDQTSLEYTPLEKQPENLKVGILKGDLGLSPEVAASYEKAIAGLKKQGLEIIEIELKQMEQVVPVYYTIATAEASANLARFNGIRYGHRPDWAENPEELIRKSRHEGFGDEVKLRILLGTYVLRSGFQDQYYVRAQKIRTLIRQDYDQAFNKADIIMMPAFPTAAFKHGKEGLDQFQQKVADKFTCSANLAGIPAMTVPVSVENNLPVGIQFLAPAFEEARLFKAARIMKEEFPVPVAPAYPKIWS